jgi:hypothetical protein
MRSQLILQGGHGIRSFLLKASFTAYLYKDTLCMDKCQEGFFVVGYLYGMRL